MEKLHLLIRHIYYISSNQLFQKLLNEYKF